MYLMDMEAAFCQVEDCRLCVIIMETYEPSKDLFCSCQYHSNEVIKWRDVENN